ncbi:Uncharacterized protein ACO02O_01795 [Dirofilaria immitis]
MLNLHIITDFILLFPIISIIANRTIVQNCHQLLTCINGNNCLQIPYINGGIDGSLLSKQIYNDFDKGIDYSCIFATGCFNECNECPLCQASKGQLIDVLSGNQRSSTS